jgi:glycosyltransferase involved in cell wall biosynthesis/peptidoglycan/xylan/chitin deacetylase (PgdA/CDA1 family)
VIELSVVLATYNRVERLRACLEALAHQTQPCSDFEVVVIVDGSTDGTREMLAEFAAPFALQVMEQENSGQCVALNRGVALAQGRICLLIDDDILAAPELVAEHIRLHQGQANTVGIGRLKLVVPSHADWFAQAFARDWQAHYARFDEGAVQPSWDDCYGGNLSMTRSNFLEIGGFVTDLPRNYDYELAYRLQQRGCSFIYLTSALGCQDERKGFRALMDDSERAGASSVELYHRFPPMLPQLLGKFAEAPLSETLLCHMLLTLTIAPSYLEPMGRLLAKLKSPWVDTWQNFLHRFCFWRGVRRALPNGDSWKRLAYGTPILMYHAFGATGEPASRYVTPIRRFARQMAWLKQRNYQVIGLEELIGYRLEHRLPPDRSVVITMDDGYEDNRTLAYPILTRYGFTATIFLVSDQMGKPYYSEIDSELNSRPVMSWQDAQGMLAGGVTFGAHTRTHPNLARLSMGEAREEIEGSQRDIEHHLSQPMRLFSYPFGADNADLRLLVEQLGFTASCTTHVGLNTPATPAHRLRRVEVYGTDSLLDFALAVRFGDRRENIWRRLVGLIR